MRGQGLPLSAEPMPIAVKNPAISVYSEILIKAGHDSLKKAQLGSGLIVLNSMLEKGR